MRVGVALLTVGGAPWRLNGSKAGRAEEERQSHSVREKQ